MKSFVVQSCWKERPDRSGRRVLSSRGRWRQGVVFGVITITRRGRRRAAIGAGAGTILWSLGALRTSRSLGSVIRRTEGFIASVGMGEHVGADHATIEPALHGDGLALGDGHAPLAARSGIDQRTATA